MAAPEGNIYGRNVGDLGAREAQLAALEAGDPTEAMKITAQRMPAPTTQYAGTPTMTDVTTGTQAVVRGGGQGAREPSGGLADITSLTSALPPSLRPVMDQRVRLSGDAQSSREQEARLTGQAQTRVAEQTANLRQEFAGRQRRERDEMEARIRPTPEFVPTRETMGEMATLFSLLAVAGQALGGKGKQGAMGAMASMTGMLNGWKQGRSDLYQQERQKFEADMRQIQEQNRSIQEAFRRGQEIARTDLAAGLAHIQTEAARLNAPIIAEAARRGGIEAAGNMVQQLVGPLSQIEQRRAAEQVRVQQEQRAQERQLQQWRNTQGPNTQYLFERTGQNINKDSANRIVDTSKAIGEGLALVDQANRLPENIGRSGQVRSFFQRYMTSADDAVRNNLPTPSPNLTSDEQRSLRNDRGAQDALLFAKRYASYLVAYERSLAGGARGFTVSFQNRFNNLMAQEQFTRQGLTNLLRDHVQELALGAASPGTPQFDFNNLARMGVEIRDSSSLPAEQGSAQRGLDIITREHSPRRGETTITPRNTTNPSPTNAPTLENYSTRLREANPGRTFTDEEIQRRYEQRYGGR